MINSAGIMEKLHAGWRQQATVPCEIRAGKGAYAAFETALREVSFRGEFEGAPFSSLYFHGTGAGSAQVVRDDDLGSDDVFFEQWRRPERTMFIGAMPKDDVARFEIADQSGRPLFRITARPRYRFGKTK